jgi:cytochrome P450
VIGDGLVTAEGEKWRAHRRAINPAFSSKNIRDSFPALVKIVNKLSSKIELKNEKAFDIDKLLVAGTMVIFFFLNFR